MDRAVNGNDLFPMCERGASANSVGKRKGAAAMYNAKRVQDFLLHWHFPLQYPYEISVIFMLRRCIKPCVL